MRFWTGSADAGRVWFDVVPVAGNRIGEDGTHRSWVVEHRYRAVLEVLDGGVIADVARQFGTTRQSIYTWKTRYLAGGLEGLADRSSRPRNSPSRVPVEVEAAICEMRRQHPRWGAQRIAFELAERGVRPAPSRSTAYRVLVRHGLVNEQQQQHRRKYRRWQRDAPMQLWQLDIMGGVFLADGRECKLVTGIDDHSRFVVIAQVVAEPSGRAVCQAFTDAMSRYGVPSEVLTDNGKQFTGRFSKPYPAEVLFERICRENGITARLTKPRTPTTTGKIERWHQSLRGDFLDDAGPFADLATAQAAIDAWVHGYNYRRPHQSLQMATPYSLFRPHPVASATPESLPVAPAMPVRVPDRLAARSMRPDGPSPEKFPITVDEREIYAVELEMMISPAGRIVLPGGQDLKFNPTMAGRTVTVWASDRTIHVLIGGELLRTRPSRLSATDLATLVLRGARPAGPEPGPSAIPRGPLPAAMVVEIGRTVGRDGDIQLAGHRIPLGAQLAGKRVALRIDGHLMHVIADGLLARTLPAPVTVDQVTKLRGARVPDQSLPPAPSQTPRAQRRVPKDGIIMVAKQRLRVGASHAGKTVIVVIEDTLFRVLHNDIELSVHTRKNPGPIRQYKASARTRTT